MKRKYFWDDVPTDCKKAIKELEKLKVFNLCGWDYEETFADVWWLVLHEVDLYAEGEYGQGEGFYESDPAYMNRRSAKAADKWLCKWYALAWMYSLPEQLSDYHKQILGDWGEGGIDYYDGQID